MKQIPDWKRKLRCAINYGRDCPHNSEAACQCLRMSKEARERARAALSEKAGVEMSAIDKAFLWGMAAGGSAVLCAVWFLVAIAHWIS